MRRLKLFVFLVAHISFLSTVANAQMFSVDDDRPARPAFPSSFLRVGYSLVNFEYMGDITTPQGPEALAFSSGAFVAAYEGNGLSVNVAVGNNLSGLKERNFFDLSLAFSNRFAVIRNRSFAAGFPVQLGTGITTSSSDNYDERFNQTHFAINAGGFVLFRISDKVTIENSFMPGYGFSNSNGGFFGGTAFVLDGRSRINLLRLIGNRTLSLGYDFNYKSFDIDDELYDYDLTLHLITIGISL